MKLQHVPQTKQQIKEQLYAFLYGPVEASDRKRLKEVILRNCHLQKSTHPSLTYRGEVSIAEDCTTAPPKPVTPLSPQLKAEMDDYLQERANLDTHELPYVMGFINQVLNSSDGLPDYLQVLPNSVHRPIEKAIASCGCRTTQLKTEQVEDLKQRNAVPLKMMRERLVLNVLL